jgi:hypothetical protein
MAFQQVEQMERKIINLMLMSILQQCPDDAVRYRGSQDILERKSATYGIISRQQVIL